MRFGGAEEFAEFGEGGEDDVGDVGSGGFGGGGFAGEDEDAERAGAPGHFHVGVETVADHGELGGLELVTFENSAEHGGVGLAHDGVGRASGGGGKHGADGAAIDEDGGLIGRANAVGVGGDERFALFDPPRGAAESRVGEGGVEADDDGVGNFVRRIREELKTGGGKFATHAGRAEDEKFFRRGRQLVEKLDGGLSGSV